MPEKEREHKVREELIDRQAIDGATETTKDVYVDMNGDFRQAIQGFHGHRENPGSITPEAQVDNSVELDVEE